MEQDDDLEELGRLVVDAGLKVHRALGPGLLESVYEHCMAYELDARGLKVRRTKKEKTRRTIVI